MLFGFDLPLFAILFAALFALFIASVIYKAVRGTGGSDTDELPPPG